VARDSGAAVTARRVGVVVQVDASVSLFVQRKNLRSDEPNVVDIYKMKIPTF
jgi:DNA-directed RNA polymerase subunit beta